MDYILTVRLKTDPNIYSELRDKGYTPEQIATETRKFINIDITDTPVIWDAEVIDIKQENK